MNKHLNKCCATLAAVSNVTVMSNIDLELMESFQTDHLVLAEPLKGAAAIYVFENANELLKLWL